MITASPAGPMNFPRLLRGRSDQCTGQGWVVGELPDRDGDPGLDCLAIVIVGGAAAYNGPY
jgi:hypothetical protein